jgi:hypothetical protein
VNYNLQSVDDRWLRLLLDIHSGYVQLLSIIISATGFEVELSLNGNPVPVSWNEGGNDREGRENRDRSELSLEFEVDDLFPAYQYLTSNYLVPA